MKIKVGIKLITGFMLVVLLMVALGMVLLLKPEVLQNFKASMLIVVSAVIMSVIIILGTKKEAKS